MQQPCRHSATRTSQEESRTENLPAIPQHLLQTTLPNCLQYPTMQLSQNNLSPSVWVIVSRPPLHLFHRTDNPYPPLPTSQSYSAASHFSSASATTLPTSC